MNKGSAVRVSNLGIFAIFIAVSLLAGFAFLRSYTNDVPSLDGLISHTFDQRGVERVFYTYSRENPENSSDASALIMVTHGYKGSAATTIRRIGSQFNRLAEENNLVIVYPDARDGLWMLGGLASDGDASDLDYFQTVLSLSIERYSVDSDHVFLVGESQGAMASYAIACSGGIKISALIAVVMPQPAITADDCRNSPDLAFALFTGTKDSIVNYWGGHVRVFFRKFGYVLSSEMTIDLWKRKNGCLNETSKFSNIDPVADNTNIELRSWVDCDSAPMRHYTIVNGGHTWPSADYKWYERIILGQATSDINIVNEIWSFLGSI